MKKTMLPVILLAAAFIVLIDSCASTAAFEKYEKYLHEVGEKFLEGDFYAYQFEQYKAAERERVNQIINPPAPREVVPQSSRARRPPIQQESPKPSSASTIGSSRESPAITTRRYGEMPEKTTVGGETSAWVPEYRYPISEENINRAITAYEEVLRLEPKGTWKIPSYDTIRKNDDIYRKSNKDTSYRQMEDHNTRYKNLWPPEGGVQARLAEARRVKEQWLTVEKPQLEQLLKDH
jgi:hypothetical protein